jgi:putative tryptophan/tyrosine transport system substrate-binding protein
MRRREFIAGLAGAAAWPLAARAQQPKVTVVGLLNGVSFEGPYAAPVAAIRQGLEETGFVEGQNLAIEQRSANGRYERLPELAADLARGQAAVIIAIGASTSALAAAASAVPIVCAMGSDAVEVGLLKSPNGPQANPTGASFAPADIALRRLELLLEFRPNSTLFGYLDNSRLSEAFDANVADFTAAARIKERELAVFEAATEDEVERAFAQMALQRIRGLIVGPDPFLATRQEQIIALAAEMRMPTLFAARGAVVLGGLMSYGVLNNEMYRVAGIYAGRILKGETPAHSLVFPSRFQLVVNTRTAKALRITMPRRLLVRADEVID